jgi:uncharacterized protein (UPF0332 family)
LLNADFSPVDFYHLASQLYKENQSEAIYRTIVNRSYYAAFLSAKEYAKITSSSGSIHRITLEYFAKRNRTVFKNLSDLKDLRNKADYQPHNKLQKHEAAQSLRLAKKILIHLNDLDLKP